MPAARASPRTQTISIQRTSSSSHWKAGATLWPRPTVHSALWHARRPKPGGEGRPRYFIDISYCQNGVKWPAYGNVEGINAMALEMGLDRDGRYRFVYDSSQFYDLRALMDRFERVNQGSLINRLELPG